MFCLFFIPSTASGKDGVVGGVELWARPTAVYAFSTKWCRGCCPFGKAYMHKRS